MSAPEKPTPPPPPPRGRGLPGPPPAPRQSRAGREARPKPVARPAQPAKSSTPAARSSAPPAPPDPLLGTTLGRCQLLERIGQGKTSTVYKAVNTATHGTVAVKVLLPSARANREIVGKFGLEARAIAKIDNENVLKIFDVGQQGEEHYLVMELLEGEEILDVLSREKRIEPLDALRIVRQAANGLAAAHAQGIIHRDVKPQNLVLLDDGTVKLVDFGLAADLDAESQRVGTPHYMAPETCESGTSETASDVYSLGITLHHLLTGQPPYAGKSVKEILQAHLTGEALHPERKVAGLKREISDLVRHMTKRDPLLRPQAMEVVAELDSIGGQDLRKKDALRGRSVRRRSPGQGRAGAGGSPAVMIGAGVGVALIVVLLVVLSGSTTKNPTPPPAPTPDPIAGPRGVGPDQNKPLPPVETAEQKARREKLEAEFLQRAREGDAKKALAAIEDWVRANWHSKTDDANVVSRYRVHAKEWKDTPAGKISDDRARQITAGKLHAHPDKTYDPEAEVEAARLTWETAKPKVEAAIAQHAYEEARKLVPEAVQDAEGSLARELAFWARLTEHLGSFQLALASDWEKIGAAQRTLLLPTGKVKLQRLLINALEIEQDGKTVRLTWAEAPPAELARLAHAAFVEKGTRGAVLIMAFAWAHRLSDEFWGAELEVGMASDKAQFEPEFAGYKRTWEERAASK
jgi:serine/threonine-protein kinase